MYFDIADTYTFHFVFHMPWSVWWHMNCVPANNLSLIVASNPGKLSYIYLHLQGYLEEVDKYKSQYFIFHETIPWDVWWPMNCACKSSKWNCSFKASFFYILIHFWRLWMCLTPINFSWYFIYRKIFHDLWIVSAILHSSIFSSNPFCYIFIKTCRPI